MREQAGCTKAKALGGFALKAIIRSTLSSPGFEESLEKFDIPPEKIISPLLSFLCAADELVRWRAVRAVGLVVSKIARTSPEFARNIMRRLIWSLNDESGGIGWGAPEAMGEIMAEDEKLADEYHCILLSYIDECGNPLENELLERGVLWGIGRIAQARPDLVEGCIDLVLKQLGSADPVKRGLAVRVLGFLGPAAGRARKLLEPLLKDESEIRIYQDGEMKTCRIADMASQILPRIGTGNQL